MIDDEEYARCKDRPEHEFEEVFAQPSPETQKKFTELLAIATIHITRFDDGRYWVAIHPPKQGNLWWHECDKSLQWCIDTCHAKAVSFRLITRF